MTLTAVSESPVAKSDYDAHRELGLARRRIVELEGLLDRSNLMLGLAANAAVRDRGCSLFDFLAALEEVVQ